MAKREHLLQYPFVPSTSRHGVKNDIALIQRNGYLSNAGTGQIFDQERYQLIRGIARGTVDVAALKNMLSAIPWPGGPKTERAHVQRLFNQIAMLDTKTIREARIQAYINEYPEEERDLRTQFASLDKQSQREMKEGSLFSEDAQIKTESVRRGVGIIFAAHTRFKFGYIEDLYEPDKKYIAAEDIRAILREPLTQDITSYMQELGRMLDDSVYTAQQKRDLREGFLWFGFQLFGPAFRYRIALGELVDQAKQISPRDTPSRRSKDSTFRYPEETEAHQTKTEPKLRRHHYGTRVGRSQNPEKLKNHPVVPLSLEDEALRSGITPIVASDSRVYFLPGKRPGPRYIRTAIKMDGLRQLTEQFGTVGIDNIEALRNMAANVGDGIIIFYQLLSEAWQGPYDKTNRGLATKIPILKTKKASKAETYADNQMLQFIEKYTDITFPEQFDESVVTEYLLKFLQPFVLLKKGFPQPGGKLFSHLKDPNSPIPFPTLDEAVEGSLLIDRELEEKASTLNLGNASLQVAWRASLEILNSFEETGTRNKNWESEYAQEIKQEKQKKQANLLRQILHG